MNKEEIVEANKVFYDEHAADYESYQWYFRNRYMQRFWQHEIDRIAHGITERPFRVLDVGCGTGNLTLKFLRHDCHITAMDVSAGMLELLGAHLDEKQRSRVTFEVNSLDGFKATAREPFDAIVECSVLHHLLDYETYLESIGKLLKPGGYVLITREPVAPGELRTPSVLTPLVDRLITMLQARILSSLQQRGKIHKKKAPDHSLAALHYYREGVSFNRLLAASGDAYEVISYRKYNRRFISFFSWLENTILSSLRMERFQYTFFSAILRKKHQ